MVISGPPSLGPADPQSSLHAEAGDFSSPAVQSNHNSPASWIRVQLPGTCGELVQGTLDGCPALVSCPIDLFGMVEVGVTVGRREGLPDASKALAAARLAAAEWGDGDTSFALRLLSNLPRSRGYGSSTADVGAVLYGVAAVLGRPVEPDAVARLAVQVEPTDSSILPGLAILDHRSAAVQRSLGPAPDLTVIVIDPGGEVDTLAFNQLDLTDAMRRLASRHEEAFTMLTTGLAGGDLQAVGEASTLSAVAHDEILGHPLLGRTISLAQQVHALGVCRAHSGTLLGVLLDPECENVAEVTGFLQSRLGTVATLAAHRMVNGGPRFGAPLACD